MKECNECGTEIPENDIPVQNRCAECAKGFFTGLYGKKTVRSPLFVKRFARNYPSVRV